MSGYSFLAQRVMFPAYDRLRGRRVTRLHRELKRSQWLSADAIRANQWRLVKALLVHSYDNVPFYRSRFEQLGMVPASILGWEDFEKLPPLTKDDIRGQFSALTAANARRFRITPGRTGGSTGKPTHFCYSLLSRDFIRASVLRNIEWAGLNVGDRFIRMSGSHFDHTRSMEARVRLIHLLLRQKNISSSELSLDRARDWVALMREYRPKVLWGYASAVSAFASLIRELGVRDLRLHSVITSSDTLFEEQRNVIEDVFNCRVFDLYSSREFHMAGECEMHDGYHIAAESVLVEVVKDGRGVVDQDGTVLVTDLHNYGFPFIRYEIGDVGRLTTRCCSCGRGLPLMEAVVGRTEDLIVTPSGRMVSPPGFTVLFGDVVAVRDYQLVQDRPDRVLVKIVKEVGFSEADMAYLANGLSRILGDDVHTTFIFPLVIPRGESGKRRVVISNVPRNI